MRANLRKLCLLAIISALMLCCSPSFAEGTAITGKIGTLGLGVDLTAYLSESFNARLGVNYLDFDYERTESDIDYDLNLDFTSASALLDWFPFKGEFRISGGLFYNDNSINADAEPTDSLSIGSTDYSPAQVGTLSGTVDFDEFVPYVGIGWGNAVIGDKKVKFSFDLGIVFQGTPKVNLTADGPISSNAAFQADLAQEEADFQDDADDFEYYPVIAFGLSFIF